MTNQDLSSFTIDHLEEMLSNFDPQVRKNALNELIRRAESGEIAFPPIKNEVNLHFHTFYSFNAKGWSPSRIAWEARKYGLLAAGIVDFDVLDGLEEFLCAADIVGLRSTVALETRVFISEYSQHVMTSPNEPGITYYMAGGCYKLPELGSKSAETLSEMRTMARRRNIQVMEKVNNYLDKVRLDYDKDIIPLTPTGNATERHMLAAYDSKSREIFGSDIAGLISFWANALEISNDEASALIEDTPKFHEKMRNKLMKFGGVGYVAPTPDTFPSVEKVIEMINGIRALPMVTWLDGTNSGEADMHALLSLLDTKGNVAMNIIPDRNWNIKDPEERRIKVENLGKAVQAARDLNLPLCVGTEMNKAGLPFVDNFSAPELQPFVQDFIDGALILWGHTFLSLKAEMGYMSSWAEAHFGKDRAKKNNFYLKVGRIADPANNKAKEVEIQPSLNPGEVIRIMQT